MIHIYNVNPQLESKIQSLKGSGQPLSTNDRAYFEPRFGLDFSQVRVHTDTKAAESAGAVNARAFTMGHNVVFGEGQYALEIGEGRLLAHELTHVVQQKEGVGKRLQRYEGGEHAQMGETQGELKTAFAPISYTVQKGDTLNAIVKKFGITVAELKDANKPMLKKMARQGW